MSDSETNWQDLVVGDRMAVDNDFEREVEQSQFSRQQWGLVMTATEFHVEHPADEERARIVADASNVAAVLSEFENVEQAQAIGAAGGAGGSPRDSSGGLVDSIKNALGLGGGGGRSKADDDEAVEAAQRLTQSYADALQRRLEDQGRWDEVRAAARD